MLQAIGCDNCALLSAACDKHDGIINVPEALAAKAGSRSAQVIIVSLLHTGGFHRDEGAEEIDALDDNGVYVYIEEDPEEEHDASLEA